MSYFPPPRQSKPRYSRDYLAISGVRAAPPGATQIAAAGKLIRSWKALPSTVRGTLRHRHPFRPRLSHLASRRLGAGRRI